MKLGVVHIGFHITRNSSIRSPGERRNYKTSGMANFHWRRNFVTLVHSIFPVFQLQTYCIICEIWPRIADEKLWFGNLCTCTRSYVRLPNWDWRWLVEVALFSVSISMHNICDFYVLTKRSRTESFVCAYFQNSAVKRGISLWEFASDMSD